MVKKKVKLPHGSGSIYVLKDGRFAYKKNVTLPDGNVERKRVVGYSEKECMELMFKYESEIDKVIKEKQTQGLSDAMMDWVEDVKKHEIKEQSYRRLRSTIKNHICGSSIGKIRYGQVSTEQLQQLIDSKRFSEQLSFSSIKKIFDALGAFYEYICGRNKIDNPMLHVSLPRRIKSEEKKIEWFEEADIDKFIKEATARYSNGALKHKYGLILSANIFMGLRCGELIALQWKDIDLVNNKIWINKTVIEIDNPEYSDGNTPKTKQVIQDETKTGKNRVIPINKRAKDYILEYKKNCVNTKEEDYIMLTKNGRFNTIHNICEALRKIEQQAGTDVQYYGTHILRHSCAYLYYKNGVRVEILAKILGNSPSVCQEYYLHFSEGQMEEAVSSIENIDL